MIDISGSKRGELESQIVAALRDCIRAHGTITSDNAHSAAKRVIGVIKVFNKAYRQKIQQSRNGRSKDELDVIDLAKAIIMSRNGASEQEAYSKLRRDAMANRMPIIEMAKQVVSNG